MIQILKNALMPSLTDLSPELISLITQQVSTTRSTLQTTQLLIIVLAVQREPFPSHLLKALGLVFSSLLRD